jgi:flap endonuclease-1
VRELFKKPSVTSIDEVIPELKWEKPNEEALKEFLVKEKGFNEEKVEKGLKKILKNQGNLGKT